MTSICQGGGLRRFLILDNGTSCIYSAGHRNTISTSIYKYHFPALQLSIRIPIVSIYRRNFVFHEIIYEVFCLCWFVLVGACVALCRASCVKTTLDNVITKCPKYLISNKTVDKSVLKEHNLLRLFCKFYLPVVFLHPF